MRESWKSHSVTVHGLGGGVFLPSHNKIYDTHTDTVLSVVKFRYRRERDGYRRERDEVKFLCRVVEEDDDLEMLVCDVRKELT